MSSLALLDIAAPYLLTGESIGEPLHELLSALFVHEVETSFDDEGVAITGVARFSADLAVNPRFTPPASLELDAALNVDHRATRRDGAWWDFPDIAIAFRLAAPRHSSPVVDLVLSGGRGGTPPPLEDEDVRDVLIAMGHGQPAPGMPAADAPGTIFRLELLLDAATLHLPFLTGALLRPDGVLAVDPANPDVSVTFPKIKLSIEQSAGSTGSDGAEPSLTVAVDSWAADDIDDPAGTLSAAIVTMEPPYALFGPDAVLGFGFHSVVLDLSTTHTPPQLLEAARVGADFRGIYLPDVRVFVQPPGAEGLSVDVSARELLIGLGPEGGISGVFGLDVVQAGAPQSATVRVYNDLGRLLARLDVPTVEDLEAPVPPHTTDTIQIPNTTQWIVDATGGHPPYRIEVDGQVQGDGGDEPVEVALAPDTDTRDVVITIADIHEGGRSRSVTVPVMRTAPTVTTPAPTGEAQPASVTVLEAGPADYRVTVQDQPRAERVTLVFAPTNPDHVAVEPSSALEQPVMDPGQRLTVDLPHGAQVEIATTWPAPAPASQPLQLTAYFPYGKPDKPPGIEPVQENSPVWKQFADQSGNVRTGPSLDEPGPGSGWTPGATPLTSSPSLARFVAAAQADPTARIELVGTASGEHLPNLDYNVALSQRRIWVLRRLLLDCGVANDMSDQDPQGEAPSDGPYLEDGRGEHRQASAILPVPAGISDEVEVVIRISRPARPNVPSPRLPTAVTRYPVDSTLLRFRNLHLRVEVSHNRLIAVEMRLQVDVETALEDYLAHVEEVEDTQAIGTVEAGQPRLPIGTRAAPDDGVIDLRAQLTLDDTVDRWQLLLSLFETDPDGFLQSPRPGAGPGSEAQQNWRTFFGALVALTPLLDAAASAHTPAGDLAALTIGVAVPLAVTGTHIVSVPRITLYGGEVVVAQDPAGLRIAVLFDLEVALAINFPPLLESEPDNPVTVRYRAIGFATSDTPQVRDLVPVFDSSRGYSIDIPSTGGVRVPGALGDILQVAGARIARTNPVVVELDLELKADLGVVSVDRTTIRIPLGGGAAPTISALGVHLNVPGAIEGHGYVAIYPDGFAGQLDVSLPSLGVRIAAALSVRHVVDPTDPDRTATAVFVGLEVDFPVPILLGASGFGIYGFAGLFAMHHRRNEDDSAPVPALAWLEEFGSPTNVAGWVPEIDRWAIGLGAVVGTVDQGFTLNVKGMLLIELPGPRVLLVMRARILSPRPARPGPVEATILAVIDIDPGRRRITVALTFEYSISVLLRIHVPARAIFPYADPAHFAFDVGTWYAPATVEFFEIFSARGYLMIRGRGIPDPDYDAGNEDTFPLPPLSGFSIALGVTSSITWGNRSSGLYLSVGSAIDAGIGFAPVLFAGSLRLWGALHLWIIGIEVSASLDILAGQRPRGPGEHGGTSDTFVWIDGRVRGRIRLLFWTLEGSVHVTLGEHPDLPPTPPPLVTGVSVQSRAAALLAGSSSERPIDGKLIDATPAEQDPPEQTVPIDSVLVVHVDCTPRVAPDAAFDAARSGGDASVDIDVPDGPAAPVVRRGEHFYTYRITGVSLEGGLTTGVAPVVWWPGQPDPDSETERQLALLTRVPDPHPYAVERSRHRRESLLRQWAQTCRPVAPPAPVLWTFHRQPLGTSAEGWVLPDGIPWPDPPDSTRHTAPPRRLDIAEIWRTGDPAADLMADAVPARVLGGPVSCPPGCLNIDQTAGAGCYAHLLVSPRVERPNTGSLGAHPLGAVLTDLLNAAAEQHDELTDVLALRTGRIAHLRILLQADARLFFNTDTPRLRLRCLDGEGTVLDEVTPTGSDAISRVVSDDLDLPESWRDPTGPWRCRVAEVMAFTAARLLLVDMDVPEGTEYVHVGLVAEQLADYVNDFGIDRRYRVGVVEALSIAEVGRSVVESQARASSTETLNQALEPTPDLQALLLPGTTYTLRTHWQWASCDADGQHLGEWTDPDPDVTTSWRFRTDTGPLQPPTVTIPASEAGQPDTNTDLPRRLDPWVLLTAPDEGENFYFHDQPVRVVFSVDYLMTMFATYGEELRVVVRAASFAHVDPGAPHHAETVHTIQVGDPQPLPGPVVLSPWEDLVREILADAPCVDTSGALVRHRLLTLDLLLEPRTEYTLDIEPVNPSPTSGASGPARPLFRRKFTTSRYASAEAMAAAVVSASFREQPATSAQLARLLALAATPDELSAADVDAALLDAGLRPAVVVTDPEVEVLWVEQHDRWHPRVLVLRTPEPLVRDRRGPQSYQPPSQPRLQREVVRLTEQPYLELVPDAGSPDMTILAAPGLAVAVVIVDGNHDAPIELLLRRHDSPFLGEADGATDSFLLGLRLDRPTWEVA